jgi:hypothetical protein
MLNDPGYGKRDTEDHNCLLVNGRGQRQGIGTRNRGAHTTAFGRILKCGTTGGESYLVSDATSCYGEDLVRYQRHVLLAEGGYVLVFDDVQTASPGAFAVKWHTLRDLVPDGADGAAIRTETTSLHLVAAADAAAAASVAGARFDRTFRIESGDGLTTWRLFTVLAPDRSPQVSASFSEGAASVTVNGHAHVFRRSATGGYTYESVPVVAAPRPGE